MRPLLLSLVSLNVHIVEQSIRSILLIPQHLLITHFRLFVNFPKALLEHASLVQFFPIGLQFLLLPLLLLSKVLHGSFYTRLFFLAFSVSFEADLKALGPYLGTVVL